MDLLHTKELLFNILDINKDKRICETDLFQMIKAIKNEKLQKILLGDI